MAWFWDHYVGKTKAYRLQPTTALKAHSGRHPAEHTHEIVEAYLNPKGRNQRLAGGQLAQVVRALRILFADVVKYCWNDWMDSASEAR